MDAINKIRTIIFTNVVCLSQFYVCCIISIVIDAQSIDLTDAGSILKMEKFRMQRKISS